MQAFFVKHLGRINVEDLPIPLRIAAVDLYTGELISFSKGPLATCLAAGATVPGVFEPVKIGEHTCYDAGGTYNLPLELLTGENLKIIIVGNTIGEKSLMKSPRTVQDVLYQVYLIRSRTLARWRVGERGWDGKKDERVVLIDYDTGGANPASPKECRTMIRHTYMQALEVLRKELPQ
jgi:NTE family protein